MMMYPTIDLVATGKRIKELRIQNGYTVAQLQEKFGFENPNAIYKWQKGISLPTVDNLLALSVWLHTSMNDILVYDQGFVILTKNLINKKILETFKKICYTYNVS